MDIRTEKTEKAIKNAFLELRAKRPVERITIKELCALAQINKSTFYAHYQDIYDLSDKMQMETVRFILDTISHDPKFTVSDSVGMVRALFNGLTAHQSLTNILFSGKEQGRLVECLEVGIKDLVYQEFPGMRGDLDKEALLTYTIYGGYHTYRSYQGRDKSAVIQAIENVSERLRPLYSAD